MATARAHAVWTLQEFALLGGPSFEATKLAATRWQKEYRRNRLSEKGVERILHTPGALTKGRRAELSKILRVPRKGQRFQTAEVRQVLERGVQGKGISVDKQLRRDLFRMGGGRQLPRHSTPTRLRRVAQEKALLMKWLGDLGAKTEHIGKEWVGQEKARIPGSRVERLRALREVGARAKAKGLMFDLGVPGWKNPRIIDPKTMRGVDDIHPGNVGYVRRGGKEVAVVLDPGYLSRRAARVQLWPIRPEESPRWSRGPRLGSAAASHPTRLAPPPARVVGARAGLFNAQPVVSAIRKAPARAKKLVMRAPQPKPQVSKVLGRVPRLRGGGQAAMRILGRIKRFVR